jgi:hypothetical protein
MDILNPTSEQLREFRGVLMTCSEFQFGGRASEGNGICRYKAADLFEYKSSSPETNDFILEFRSDFIPRKRLSDDDLPRILSAQIPVSLPPDYKLTLESLPEFEQKRYYIKEDMEFQVIPQFFMVHLQSNYPEYNKYIAEAGLRGVGQLRSAGLGKFQLRDPAISPQYHHGTYKPPLFMFTDEEKQVLKAALLHDLIPKVGGIEYLNEYYDQTQNLSSLLIKLHYEWHELREKGKILLSEFLHQIRDRYGVIVENYYYNLALADQLAASFTRVKKIPTYSRYLAGHVITDKIDYLSFSREFLPIESPFKLWKAILKSSELALLNESLRYGDQPLSTHLLLTLNFTAQLIRGKTAYVVAKLVPTSQKKFIQGYWYKIFNSVMENEEVFLYVIEEKIPSYTSEFVKKVLVKSIRPETSWLRIQ